MSATDALAKSLRMLVALLGLTTGCALAATLPVSQADYDDWIYSVPTGYLECRNGALLFSSGTDAYALNLTAFRIGYEPAVPLVAQRHFEEHQFAQYMVRWKRQWETGGASARERYGPAMVAATTPRSLREAGLLLCE